MAENTTNKQKTILYLITQSELGGAQRYVFDLASSLKNEFNCVIGFGEQGEKGEFAKKLKKANIKYYSIPCLKRAISLASDFLALINIIKLIKKIKPDIIHLNSSKISILGSLAALIVGRSDLRVIYTAHGWVFNEPLLKWKKTFYKYVEKFTSIFKDKIICVSEFDYQAAIKEKICPTSKLVTINNGIEKIYFIDKEQAIQKLLGRNGLLPNSQKPKYLIGSIGNLYKTKGFEFLIKAAKILKNKNYNFKLIIIGEGKERKNLEKLIKNLNLKNQVILKGRIDNASCLLKAFDTYVCSSVKEGLSYTIIEAMQAGLPISATMVGGNPELIENNRQGILVKARDPKAMADAMQIFKNNQTLSNKLGNNARQKALAEFGLEQMARKTKIIYGTVAKGSFE